MKQLAARGRRSRLAPVLLLFLALVMTGAIYSFLAPTPADATRASSDDVAAGQDLFRANCATCHGTEAQGTDAGPSLIGVGAASVDFQVSTGRMPMAHNAPQAEPKPSSFDEEATAQMAAYIASLAPGPAIPTAEMVDPAKGDPANGMEIFRTNCSMCHNAVGAGGALSEGKYAPSLHEPHVTDTVVYEAMVTGPQSMPVFNDANVTPEEKRDVIAYLEAQRGTSPGGFSLGNIGPVSEGLWAWIVGIGGLIGIAVWIGAKSS